MPASRDTRLQSVLPAAILAVLLAVLWVWFVPRAHEAAPTPPGFDTWDFHNYFLPRYVFGTQELLAGRFPLWNRLEFAGMPFMATLQPAALYPPKILAFALLRPETAMTIFLVAHYLLIAGGFLLFLRGQGIGGLGALAGGAYLTFNGMLLISGHHPNRIGSLAWIPLIFWLADRVVETKRRAPLAALAVAVAMQLLVGYPEFTLHTALLLGVQAIAMWAIGAWTTPPWRSLPRLAVAFVLGGMLAGLQLAPFAELSIESQRSAAAAAFIAKRANSEAPGIGLTGFFKVMLQFLPGLSVFSLAALTRRRGIPPLAANVFAALMGAGGWLLLRALPIFSGIRHGLIWIVTAQFANAWLIAVGADAFATPSGRPRLDRAVAWIVGLGALQWGALCLLGLLLPAATAAVEATAPTTPILAAILEVARAIYGGALGQALGLAGSALLAIAAFAAKPPRVRVGIGFAAVTLLALGHVVAYPLGVSVGPFRPPDVPDRLARLVTLPSNENRGRTLSSEDLRWGYTFYDRSESVFGLEMSLQPARFRALTTRLDFEANWHRLDWAALGAAEGFLDALDVEWVVAPASAVGAFGAGLWEAVGADAVRERTQASVALHNRERPGRAWVVYGASVAASEQAALDRLLSLSFDPRREVILEAPLASVGSAPANDPSTPARVQVVSPTHVEVEAELPRPGMLVLSESWFPGWVASVDGAPAEILRADYVLRGVALAAGSHRVRFEYRPVSVRIGAGLTLLGVYSVLGLVWSDRRGHEVKS